MLARLVDARLSLFPAIRPGSMENVRLLPSRRKGQQLDNSRLARKAPWPLTVFPTRTIRCGDAVSACEGSRNNLLKESQPWQDLGRLNHACR